MDTLEAIFTRRSVRQYMSKAVPDTVITELLKAAMAAPSAGNEQPWHFVVIRDRGLLDAIPQFHPYSAMLKHASAAILVCGDPSLERHKGYWVQDCSAASQNILLAAVAMGLGAVWTGVYPIEERMAGMRKLLGLPEQVVPLSLIPVGYPAEYPHKAERFNVERVHHDRW